MLAPMLFRETHVQTPIAIRAASQRDLATVGDLWVEMMTFHAALDARFSIPPHGRANYIRNLRNNLRDDNFRVFVAVEGRRVIGYVMGYIGENPPIFTQQRYGFIADLCVTQVYRQRGVGEKLVTAMCDWFRRRGLENAQMNVAHGNPSSQAFWRKIGGMDYLDHMWLDLTERPRDGR